jgi:hypothetical protein
MGVIASSDNHRSQPGKEGYGMLAVLAPALTREAIFDAIARRRTYATTGSRILLDFAVAGTPMGGECRLAPGEPARIAARVDGTAPLAGVDVVRGDLDAGAWQVVFHQSFNGRDAPRAFEVDWTDPAPPRRCLYYVRVRQRDFIHGREPMAWSSPVWLESRGRE